MEEEEFHKQITLPTSMRQHLKNEKIPLEIGPYKIEALLEKGGMSYLYLASHPETKEPITIKALFPEYATNAEVTQRFLREAEIIALADHPNIVKLYGYGKWEGGLYIAMEFIHGISLRQYLTHNIISLKHALEIVIEIAMALCHLHAHGVIHRDLKPENILITETGGIKVIDFGIAQLLTEEVGGNPSQKKRLIGTPIYMSPEQKESPESTSYPSDIYSLGIIAYELALGKLSLGQIYLSIMPKGLQKILFKALQPKPEDRYQDIVDFMTELSLYMHSNQFLKENKEVSPLSELSEGLRSAQYTLLPSQAPIWPLLDVKFAHYKSFSVSSIYYDFIEMPNETYAIIVGESTAKESPGIIYTSVLRGMVRSLSQLSQRPEEIATILNELLIQDPMKQTFAFSYLALFPNENKVKFISCGCGELWHISKGHVKHYNLPYEPLGTKKLVTFSEKEIPWKTGDSLILYACLNNPSTDSEELFSTEKFYKLLQEGINLSPQRQVEMIMRKAKILISSRGEDLSFFVTSIFRLGAQGSENELPIFPTFIAG